MSGPSPSQFGRPKGSTSRRFALYFLGVAIGLVMVGFLMQLRRVMVPPQPEQTGQPAPAQTGP